MQSMASPSTSYAAPAVISLGEEYTDAMLPSEQQQEPASTYDNEGYYYSSSSDSDTESSQDEDEDDADSEYSPKHHHRRSSIIPPSLWQAEHARLLSLQTAVLDNERAAWTREKRLESEVARIKFDLARLQKAAAATQEPPRSTEEGSPATLPSSPPPPRCAGPRGPRPKPQQNQQSRSTPPSAAQARTTGSTAGSGLATESASIVPPPLLPKFSFESISLKQSKPEEQAAVSVLSHHLTEARSLRAQERQRRRQEHERMRELATLLTLGSEVRKWEERLAWSQIQSNTRAAASDDSHLNKESLAKANNNNDTDVDPRGKRLSRSSSLPSNRMSYLPPPAQPATTSTSGSNSTRPPLSPALPSLALSPLWKVSAEMILRRRQLSERPRRTPRAPLAVAQVQPPVVVAAAPVPVLSVPKPVPANPTSTSGVASLARPAHTLRGPREKRTVSAATSSSISGTNGKSSPITVSPTLPVVVAPGSTSASSSLSGKRNSIPPPISIPPSAPFCTSTAVPAVPAAPVATIPRLAVPIGSPSGSCSFFISKTTPVKPSALKWAFTAADLAREMQAEEEIRRKALPAAVAPAAPTSAPAALITVAAGACCTGASSGESSEESGSDDSGKSSSDGSGHSSSSSCGSVQEFTGNVERRGRARFSWRKSIPKDGSANAAVVVVGADWPPIPNSAEI